MYKTVQSSHISISPKAKDSQDFVMDDIIRNESNKDPTYPSAEVGVVTYSMKWYDFNHDDNMFVIFDKYRAAKLSATLAPSISQYWKTQTIPNWDEDIKLIEKGWKQRPQYGLIENSR